MSDMAATAEQRYYMRAVVAWDEQKRRAEAAEARVRELEAALQQSRDDHQGAVEKLRAVEALAKRLRAEVGRLTAENERLHLRGSYDIAAAETRADAAESQLASGGPPTYVLALARAVVTGQPVDFGDSLVPRQVQEALSEDWGSPSADVLRDVRRAIAESKDLTPLHPNWDAGCVGLCGRGADPIACSSECSPVESDAEDAS
jgi:predicted phage gp36 major capsid-like protein